MEPKKITTDIVKAARAFAREHDLSEAQLDVLRKAARKYDTYWNNGKEDTKLHNGEIPTYGIMSATITILRERGLVRTRAPLGTFVVRELPPQA